MPVLVDTSVLGRLANRADAQYGAAQASVAKLDNLGDRLFLTAQNLVGFRNVATRPITANGLGLSPAEAAKIAGEFEAEFGLLPETADVYPAWRNLADAFGVIGKQVHDARLVAVCQVHGVDKVLTFNVPHFARFASAPPGILVINAALP